MSTPTNATEDLGSLL
ncbi:5f22ba64-0008-4f2a-a9dc-1c23f4ae7511 [Thermothielavioides terrestris]|uniref:5f22ba64-0008-4f2a-a9dc-1c23f4ae7511 n=1 Tax=Thermothielavioides terrestris TaxID=2587410 RepID=A0A446BU66_9PEZI|nr:5f22ba64-0008-4f2a-a9dc-1c23f4ae7511 [Thermothielavioides terrestris]